MTVNALPINTLPANALPNKAPTVKIPLNSSYDRTRRFRIILTDEQALQHERGIEAQNRLMNFALKYLYSRFGHKCLHMDIKFPFNAIGKLYLAKEIKAAYAKTDSDAGRWDSGKTGLYSHAAEVFLVTLITNFGEYRKKLIESSKWSDEEKTAYKENKHGNNPGGKSWFRRGAPGYIRSGRTTKTISFPDNGGGIKILSPHAVKLPWFGVIEAFDNISSYKGQDIQLARVKLKDDGTYELQLTFRTSRKRKPIINKVGADWNMKDNEAFSTTGGETISVLPEVVAKANALEDRINKLKSKRDSSKLSEKGSRYRRLDNKIQYLFAKRANILNEEYLRIAHKLVDKFDLIAIESLSARDMYLEQSESKRHNGKGSGINRRLATLKPATLSGLVVQVASRQRKTVIKVDPYCTTQTHYGTHFKNNWLTPDDRVYISEYDGTLLYRDHNSSWNILAWALNPEDHQKIFDRNALIKQQSKMFPPPKNPAKPIKPEWLVSVR